MSLPEDIWKKLRDDHPAKRKAAWNELDDDCEKYSWTDNVFQDLYLRLKDEPDLDVRSYGLTCLHRISQWARHHILGESSLQSWLLEPFRPANRGGSSGTNEPTSAVVAVCDHEHIRDVQPLVKIARVLHEDAYWNTTFHHIPLNNPDWTRVGVTELSAICFIGRPSMFVGCDLLDELPTNRHFNLPVDDETWRGKPLTPESARRFHHIIQQRPTAGRFLFETKEDKAHRVDYAVVQRFVLRRGSRKTVVLILAGATSLGTVGAANWLTSRAPANFNIRKCIAEAGRELRDETGVEVLLKVKANVHTPARPWEVSECVEEKLFVNDSLNVLSLPKVVTIGPKGVSDPRDMYVLLDDDEVTLSGATRDTLIAICQKAHRDKTKSIDWKLLQEDHRVWPNGQHPFNGYSKSQEINFLRDHLKRGLLRGALTVEEGRQGRPLLKLGFQVKVEQPVKA